MSRMSLEKKQTYSNSLKRLLRVADLQAKGDALLETLFLLADLKFKLVFVADS